MPIKHLISGRELTLGHATRRLLWAAALFASLCAAQPVPTVSNIVIDGPSVDPTSLRLFFDSSAKFVNYRVRYGFSSCASGTGQSLQLNGTSLGTVLQYGMSATMSGLTAGATYHICPEVTADGTNYSSGADVTFTMPAGLPSGGPAPPVAPVIVSTAFPAQTGRTYNVASDCHDLQADINAAHYGDTIQIAPGTVCTQWFTLPNAPEAKTYQPSAVHPSTGTITLAAHGFQNGQNVHISSGVANGGCLPGQEIYPNVLNCDKGGGLRKGADYYIKRVDANNFQLSATPGGPAIPFGYLTATANVSGSTIQVITPGVSAFPAEGVVNLSFAGPANPIQFTTTGTLPGGINAATDYYALSFCANTSSQVCNFQVSLTPGGSPVTITSAGTGIMTIVGHGVGPQYVMAWPPANQWIVVRTSSPDSQFTPPGVRTSDAWQPYMATIQQPGSTYGQSMFNPGILTHNWRFVGIEWTNASFASDISTTIDPRPGGKYIYSGMDTANIIFDRNYLHGLGYPDRMLTSVTLDGNGVGFINSQLSQMDFWHPWYSGFTPSFTSSTATFSAGQAFMGQISPATTGNTVVTITGGSGSGSGYVYFDLTGVLQVLLPTGITATCATTGVSCVVGSSSYPVIPVNGIGSKAGEGIGYINVNGSTVTGAGPLDGFSSQYATEGCQCMILGNGPGPYIMDNNYISGTGIPVHFDDSGGPYLPRGNYYIHRNLFSVPLTQMAGGPISNGLRYGHRQPLEWKAGQFLLVDGNIFNGNFREDNPASPFIALTSRSGGWMTDVQVTNNTFEHGPQGLNVCVAVDQSIPVSRPCQRQVYRNNLFLDLNAFSYYASGQGISLGLLFYGGYANSDFVADHNTVTDLRGQQPQFIHIVGYQGSNYQITSNLFTVPGGPSSFIGSESEWACPGGGNLAFVNCVFPTYKIAGNVVIPGWTDTSVPSGATDPGTLCVSYGGAWNGSTCAGGLIPHLATGPDVPSRLASLKLIQSNKPSLSNMLAFNSPWVHTGTDGRDPGIDAGILNQAQGTILVGDVAHVTASSVTIPVTVPDAGASCTVGYGLSQSPITWSRTPADTTNSTVRTFVLTGLQSAKVYTGQVWCAGAPPGPLNFSTL